MVHVLLMLLALEAGAGAAEAERVTFWLDVPRVPSEQVDVIASAMERMASRTTRVGRASRREEADLLVRLWLGSERRDRPREAEASAFSADPDAGTLEVSPTGTSTVSVELAVLDILQGTSVYERRARCRLPLTSGARIADPALRAHLSNVIDVIDDHASARVSPPTETKFGVSVDERERLGTEKLARLLYGEAVRASDAGYHEVALNLLADAQPELKKSGLRREEGLAWERLAALMDATGRAPERSITYAKQAVRIAREVSRPAAEARALTLLAVLESRAKNYPRALELLQAERRQSRDQKLFLLEAAAVANTAGVTAIRGDFERARTLQNEALALARRAGEPGVEGRFRLAIAVVSAHLDDRNRADTLSELQALSRLARETGDLSLDKDIAFVQANVRLSTTSLGLLTEGEIDAIRALQLARALGDQRGEVAALALLGAFSHRLMRPARAAEYLASAQGKGRAAGYLDIVTDSLQLLGEMAPSYERGLELLDDVLVLRRGVNDQRGQIKTLSDMSRLHAGLGEHDLAWERYRQAAGVLQSYVDERRKSPYAEDIRASFLTILKSLMTTRTELPYLVDYLEFHPLLIAPDASWSEEG